MQFNFDQLMNIYITLKSIDHPGPKIIEALDNLEELIADFIISIKSGFLHKELN